MEDINIKVNKEYNQENTSLYQENIKFLDNDNLNTSTSRVDYKQNELLNFNYINDESILMLKQKTNHVIDIDNKFKNNECKLLEELENKWNILELESKINTKSQIERKNSYDNKPVSTNIISSSIRKVNQQQVPYTENRKQKVKSSEFDQFYFNTCSEIEKLKKKPTKIMKETTILTQKIEDISNLLNSPININNEQDICNDTNKQHENNDFSNNLNSTNNTFTKPIIYKKNTSNSLTNRTFLTPISHYNFTPFNNNIDNLVYETGKSSNNISHISNENQQSELKENEGNPILLKINNLYSEITNNNIKYPKEEQIKNQTSLKSLHNDFNSIFNQISPNTTFSRKNPGTTDLHNYKFKKESNLNEIIIKETKLLKEQASNSKFNETYLSYSKTIRNTIQNSPIKIKLIDEKKGSKSPKKLHNYTKDSQVYLSNAIISYESSNNPYKIYNSNSFKEIKEQVADEVFRKKLEKNIKK